MYRYLSMVASMFDNFKTTIYLEFGMASIFFNWLLNYLTMISSTLRVVSQVTLYHILKLFQSAADVNLGRKTLVSEFYEEMVFQDPTAFMQHMLTNTRQISGGPWTHDTDCK